MSIQDFSIDLTSPKTVVPAQKTPAPAMSVSVDTMTSSTTEAASGVSASAPEQEELYGRVPVRPVMEAAEGIRFDFNEGLRVQFPETEGKTIMIQLLENIERA